MLDKIKQILRDGEGLTVEFKRCGSELANSVYETVSAFSNRYGGHILLGVEDGGNISGANPRAVANMKRNFANSLNNPQRFEPTLFLALEEAVINDKTVLWCFVPPSSQVVMFGGRIYDRAEDGDMDITRNSEMVAQLHRRKAADYSERKIFPYAKNGDFDFARLMPKVRRLAANRLPDHPWADMTDEEILRSAGLYQKDRETGKSGYNLAAVLLFGRDEVIRSCTANYVTDALCRRENADRYDDRLMVRTNLIDAYGQLIEFIGKHTLDKFFLEGGQSVSIRSKIARELVSNILVHREYTSAYPAKIIIERGRIVTENWSHPKTPGRIDPNSFTPYPKNPLLANFFIQIGRADVLGSGVRNLYRFARIYSGGEPELTDGDVFKAVVPLALPNGAARGNLGDKSSDNGIVSDNGDTGNNASDNVDDNLSDKVSDNKVMSDNDDFTDNTGDNGIIHDNSGYNLSDKMNDNISDNLSDDLNDKMSYNARCQAIIAYIIKYGEINAATTAKIIGRSPQTARRILAQLVKDGVLDAAGANRNRKYQTKKT
jgi:ATP-dependent DNA helicase RecG